jgi:hypothetical protein
MQSSTASFHDTYGPSSKAESPDSIVEFDCLHSRDLATPSLRSLSRAEKIPILPVRRPLLYYAAIPEF